MTKKINKTYAIECHGIDTLQEYVDEFVKHKKVVSVSVTVTEGPSDFLALIVYREKKNGQCVICVFVVCNCANCSNNNEVCWWLGTAASCTSNYPGVHCREDARGMVEMGIYDFLAITATGVIGFVLGVVTTIKVDDTHERVKGEDK